MRSIKITLFLLALSSFSVFAQLNLSVSTSFALRSSPDLITSTSEYGANFTTYTETTSLHSFGSGMRLNLDLSYKLKKSIILGFQSSYLLGREYEQKLISASVITRRIQYQGRSLQFIPYLGFELGSFRFPIQFGIGPVIANNRMIQASKSEEIVDYDAVKLIIYGGWNVGAFAFGKIIFPFGERLSCFGEISMVQMSMETKSGEITQYIENGTDLTSQLSEEFRIIKFSRTSVDQINNPDNPTNPAQRYPFSSLNFGLGLSYRF